MPSQAHRVTGEALRTAPPSAVATAAWSLLMGIILVLVGLVQSSNPPAFVTGWRIAVVMVLVGIGVLIADTIQSDRPRGWLTVLAPLVAGLLLLALLGRYQADTMPTGGPTDVELLLLTALLGVFLLGGIDRPSLTPPTVLLIGAFAVVAGLFLYHTATPPAGTSSPTWPVWAVVVSGVSLLLIPRVVPVESFCWSVASLAAAASIVTIYAFVAGEFTLLGFEVAYNRQNIPLTTYYPAGWYGITSIFNNINVFGLVAFAGLSTAVATLHRTVVHDHRTAAYVAGGLAVLNGLGLLLSSSGAAWIAAGVTLGFFGVYLVVGRQAVFPTLVAGTLVGTLAVTVVYLADLTIDDSGRFDHWVSAIRAVRAHPSLLGHGHISTADFTHPYHPTGAHDTPHNSYLSIVIRMGVVGGVAYVILLWGTMVYRALTPGTTDVAMLAFALGWAVHHLFESYTVVQWTPAAVLSAMTLGYLLFANSSPGAATAG